MSQLNVDSIKDRTGANQPDIVGVAKAFVNFNGTGTVAIRNGFNVSSITDDGTGNYTVNFTNTMVDTNYSVTGAGGDTASAFPTIVSISSLTTSSVKVRSGSETGAAIDRSLICTAIHR